MSLISIQSEKHHIQLCCTLSMIKGKTSSAPHLEKNLPNLGGPFWSVFAPFLVLFFVRFWSIFVHNSAMMYIIND